MIFPKINRINHFHFFLKIYQPLINYNVEWCWKWRGPLRRIWTWWWPWWTLPMRLRKDQLDFHSRLQIGCHLIWDMPFKKIFPNICLLLRFVSKEAALEALSQIWLAKNETGVGEMHFIHPHKMHALTDTWLKCTVFVTYMVSQDIVGVLGVEEVEGEEVGVAELGPIAVVRKGGGVGKRNIKWLSNGPQQLLSVVTVFPFSFTKVHTTTTTS